MEHEARTRTLQEIHQTLTSGGAPESISVREFIGWFDAVRRGSVVNWHMRRELEQAGLVTVPDFESSHIDGRVQFALIPAAEAPVALAPLQNDPGEVVNAPDQELAPVPRIGGADVEPAYRVSRLLDPRITLITIAPDATLVQAATLMLRHDFSQLPVMTNERDVRGIVSWESIGPTMLFGDGTARFVRDCLKPHVEVRSTDSLFRVVNRITESNYVLVRDERRVITGILTTTDLSRQFQDLTEPFLLLGEIESHIRALIDGRFTQPELAAVRDQQDEGRNIVSVADLTFGEYIRLLERPEYWQRVGLRADRAIFVRELDVMRQLRNDVMHFDSDRITDVERMSLRNFVQFLHDMKAHQAPAR